MKVSPSTGALMPVTGFSRRSSNPIAGTAWVSHDGLLVISSIDDMWLPGTQDTIAGPTWLVSVSRPPGRATDADLMRTIEAFAMPGWDEDNHFPGVARALFCPVDETYRSACECKITETLHTEADGYQWTNDPSAPCRGCEIARLVKGLARRDMPCPLHPTSG